MYNDFKNGFQKTAGLSSILKGLGNKAKNIGEFAQATAKGEAKIQHSLDPEQMKKIMEAVEKMKPTIGPWHVLGGSILAGMGAPVGAAMVRGGASTAKEIMNAPEHPGNPNYGRPTVRPAFT